MSVPSRFRATALLGSVVASLLFGTGCHNDRPAEGPAQRAGEKVDNAASDTKNAAQDTAHDVKNDMQK